MIRSFNTSLLRNPVFRRRSLEAKLLYFLLHNNPDNHFTGLLRASIEHMAADMCVATKVAGDALAELADSQVRLVCADMGRELVWLPEMVRMLGTKISPAQIQAAEKFLANFEACPLILRVAEAMGCGPINFQDAQQWGPSPGPSPQGPQDHPRDLGLDQDRTGLGLGQDRIRTGSEFYIAGGSSPPRPVVETGQTSEPLESPRTPAPVQGRVALNTPETRPKRAPKPPKEPTATSETWDAYSSAYAQRYGSPPVRNAKVNGQLARLVEQLGADEAPPVAAFYLTHPAAIYNFHPVGLLLRDCQALRTQWMRGSVVTPTAARRNEETAANPALALLLEQRRKKQGNG